MRIVVLGCGGFVGSHLLDRLFSEEGFFVEGWDPDATKIRQHLSHPRFQFHQTPIETALASGALEKAIEHADAVVNLAAICNPSVYSTKPLDVIRANLFDVYPVVELCAKYARWLVSYSTSEVYGRTLASYLPDNDYSNVDLYELREDETPLIMGPVANQRWTYACAKQMVERIIYAHHHEHGMPFTIVRPLNFFGPRMDYIPSRDGDGVPRVLACFMAALMSDSPMHLVDGGHARRTIVSIYEATDALVRILQRPQAAQGQIFNVGNRRNEVTMAELAERMRSCYARITGDPRYQNHPIVVTKSEDFYGPGYEDCDRRMPDVSKAERLLGWEPSIGLDEILLDTMTFFHKKYRTRPEAIMPPEMIAAAPVETGRLSSEGAQ